MHAAELDRYKKRHTPTKISGLSIPRPQLTFARAMVAARDHAEVQYRNTKRVHYGAYGT